MKLRSIYIGGFGKYQNFSYEFTDGINQISAPNGSGKTTLVDFIAAMFYGIGESNKKAYSKYLRYNRSGLFGGSLSFESDGDEYKIERDFGKRKSGDNLKIYVNNDLTQTPKDFPVNILGVDVESFKRTLIAEDNDFITASDNIRSKIGNFANGTDENCSFEKINDALDKKIAYYHKPRGNNGALDISQNKIAETKRRIYKYRSEAQGSKDDILKKYELTQKEQKLFDRLKTAQAADLTHDQAEVNLKNALDQFARGVPEVRELNDIDSKKQKINALKSALSETEDKIAEIDPSIEIADKAALDRLNELSDRVVKLNLSIGEKMQDHSEDTIRLERAQLKADEYRNCRTQLENATASRKTTATVVILSILSTLILLVGVVCLFETKKLAPWIIGLSIIGYMTSVLYYVINRAKRKRLSEQQTVRNSKLLAEIAELLSDLGYPLKRQELDEQEIMRSLAAAKAYNARLSNDNASEKYKLEATKKEINAILYQSNAFGEVKTDYTRLPTIIEKNITKMKLIEDSEKLKAELFALQNQVEYFYSKYDLDRTLTIADIRKRIAMIEVYAEAKRNAEQNVEKYRRNETDERLSSTNDVKLELDKLQNELSFVTENIRRKEEAQVKADMLAQELTQETELCDKLEAEYKTLKNCQEFLAKARNNLRDRYVAPVEKKFVRYARKIKFDKGENMVFNTEMEVLYDQNGEYAPIKRLSQGEQTLVWLCYRLAIVDSIYGEQIPFLIFDDSFNKLDDNNFRQVAEAIKNLSEHTQIIYTTCHESRNII